ncbi:MAG TPA: hypothetical protein VK327_16130 [Candidatus Paceibacterota bacterium]|nr:hypothetical protein [Candidatus Paceibacterota bacterium]
MNHKIAIAGILAGSIAAASAASYTTDTTGTMNGNSKTILEATGNSFTSATFASDIATAFANNTGGVWNFDGTAFSVFSGDTITLNYGTSLSSQLVLTLNEGAGANGINQGATGGEPTSGNFLLGLGGNAATRTFTPNKPLLEIGIFNTDRNDVSRIPVLTVTYQDNTTASTSGANADNVFFHGLSGSLANPIVSFSISQNNFVRYDDLGFVAVPEPGFAALAGLGVALLTISRQRRH